MDAIIQGDNKFLFKSDSIADSFPNTDFDVEKLAQHLADHIRIFLMSSQKSEGSLYNLSVSSGFDQEVIRTCLLGYFRHKEIVSNVIGQGIGTKSYTYKLNNGAMEKLENLQRVSFLASEPSTSIHESTSISETTQTFRMALASHSSLC